MDIQTRAVIDADFFIKTTEYERGTNLFIRIMQDLNLHPVMHQFVAEIELKTNPHLSALTANGQLTVVRYADYLTSNADKADYEEYFREAFERLNLFPFPEQEDVSFCVKNRAQL